jgi:hypothetical protein
VSAAFAEEHNFSSFVIQELERNEKVKKFLEEGEKDSSSADSFATSTKEAN